MFYKLYISIRVQGGGWLRRIRNWLRQKEAFSIVLILHHGHEEKALEYFRQVLKKNEIATLCPRLQLI